MNSVGALTMTERFGVGTDPIPLESFTFPSVFEKEREKVKSAWLNVGRVEEL